MEANILPYAAMPLLQDPPPWNTPPAGDKPMELGRSVLGNSINLHGARKANLLVMAGVHGDESEGIFMAHRLLGEGFKAPVIPCLNPDGALLRQRWNRNNVDLNRNLPAPDWQPEPLNPRYPPGNQPASEPETQAFLAALQAVQPSTILSLHSYKETFVEIERPPEAIPDALNQAVDRYVKDVGIERRQSIGYPTPGALGAYGMNNGLLVLTYELERGFSHAQINQRFEPFMELLNALEETRFSG